MKELIVTAESGSVVQPSLLQGFVTQHQTPDPYSAVVLADRLPVGRVLIESSLPHLDRLFDYSVPADLADIARPGVRVKVRFAGQDLNGYLTERVASSEGTRLTPLGKVFSGVPVLTPAVFRLAEAVAARYAGSVSDVLRVAIPPRVAKLDKQYPGPLSAEPKVTGPQPAGSTVPGDPRNVVTAAVPGESAAPDVPAVPTLPVTTLFQGYHNADAYLGHLASGGSPRGVLSALQGFGAHSWHRQLAQAIAGCSISGRGAIAVVPDQRDLLLLEQAVAEVLPADSFVRLTAEDGPSVRYRNFLRVLSGDVRVVLGTRSAAFAPVADPGLFCCWDDGDDLHVERRAPYHHARDVLLLRAEQENAGLLLAGHTRSTEAQRLLNTGWAQPIYPDRTLSRAVTARVISTADSFEQERDPLASVARLPQRAWQTAKEGLKRGPVLVQVARAGYAPSLACQRCRETARCVVCRGPLMELPARHGQRPVLQCRWCASPGNNYSCSTCGSRELRRVVVGAARTAEELGKAFPGVPVLSSAGDHVKAHVPDKPALVVATVGAEPLAPEGYAAALLLDGDTLLRRESLRAGEDALRRWFNASALVRPAKDGGVVVVTAEDSQVVGALVRWDPAGYAERELALRLELGLPPAVRIASITGPEAAVGAFVGQLRLASEIRVVGPAPVAPGLQSRSIPGSDEEGQYRTLLFFPYAIASAVTTALRALKAANAAKRSGVPVQIRCDGLDVL
ncbi:primosomal protein N' [Paenarthrobacter sp. PH39-S1]|uniref:primosomal protein N' n=1 Tax=Paenarthrobacter sp. PH39-S1 TaxID=3046204 RepID=UPI0024B9FA35|nr:primosomal protein N' [Paenarthrobacter sp. PH39-S1]MDJ0355537.1 primosomal protein N' [Paenarthrobacter sp. PH39-S1]